MKTTFQNLINDSQIFLESFMAKDEIPDPDLFLCLGQLQEAELAHMEAINALKFENNAQAEYIKELING